MTSPAPTTGPAAASAPAATRAGPRLSVAVIVQDEERNLEACLESVKFADEIVVVDSHSTDRTAEIARRFTDRVFQREYQGQVDKKNHAVEKCANDWVLSVDADERVSPELAAEIRETLARGGDAAGFQIRRRTFYMGREIRHGEWNPDWVLRLFDRRRGRFGGTDPHDRVEVSGPVARLSGTMDHHPYRDFAHQIARVQHFSTLAAKAFHEQGRRAGLWMMLVRPWFRFVKGYLLKLGFLDGIPGLAIATASGFYAFARAVKLWELQRAAVPKGQA
ncbi:MAG: glycosyltransferase family 2 protein [Planctomycetales bacterium]|nr:glycosyltransferase family 2 protein [Planctomycetales bacterium]